MLKCPKCNRKRHVVTRLKKLKKGKSKKAWVDFCATCGKPLQIETIENETKTRKS